MWKKRLSTFSFSIKIALLLFVFLIVPANAQEQTAGPDPADPYARFGEYTEGSDWVIHHRVWSYLLDATVLVVPPSSRRISPGQNSPRTGTRISRGSRTAARFESNRVFYHLLDKETLTLASKYRRELEELPDYFPLKYFSKDEQLSYWLNLYNVTVYEQLAENYPVSKLKKLRNGKKGKPSLWDKKLLTVEGVSLSLNDIQNNILIRHWKSPLVLYGLYHGAIGGPSLPNEAFKGLTVNNMLVQSAKEFVNSNRGTNNRGNETQVSLMYEWGKAAFPIWERDLTDHLMGLAKTELQGKIRSSTSLIAKLYDWSIADTKGGSLSAGPKHSTAAALLTLGRSGNVGTELAPQPTFSALGGNEQTASVGGIRDAMQVNRGGITQLLNNMYKSGLIIPGAFDAVTLDLLRDIKQKFFERSREIITSVECHDEDGTCAEVN